MKKQNSGIPNLLILLAILTLAFVVTGCGLNTTPNNSNVTTSQAIETTFTVSDNTGVGTMGNEQGKGQSAGTGLENSAGTGNRQGNNATGKVSLVKTQNTNNTRSGMMGNGNGNGMMNQFSYKNGSYSANGEYYAEGKEVIGVSLTVANDIITDASVTPQAKDRTSKGYQLQFAGSFKSQVVGKKLADLKLSRVAGASLTTQGFNNAVSIIKSQAVL